MSESLLTLFHEHVTVHMLLLLPSGRVLPCPYHLPKGHSHVAGPLHLLQGNPTRPSDIHIYATMVHHVLPEFEPKLDLHVKKVSSRKFLVYGPPKQGKEDIWGQAI